MTVYRYSCPIPMCGWSLTDPPGADKAAWPPFGSILTPTTIVFTPRRSMDALEADIVGHLKNHPLVEWVNALEEVQKRAGAARLAEAARARPSTRLSCPLPQCGWVWAGPMPSVDITPQPTPFARPRELVDGVGVWPSRAVSRLVSATEESVRLHLDAHSLEDWVTALRIAQAAREGCAECGTAGACAGGPCAHPGAAKSGASMADPGDEAWGSVWLHGNWRYLTKQMTTEAREDAAAAVLRWMHTLDATDRRPAREEPAELRWWR